MSHQALKDELKQFTNDSEHLATPAEKVKTLSSAAAVVNEIIKILNPNVTGLNYGEDALEDIISVNSFRNTKVAEWFSYHPIYPDERLALKFYESNICEIKFYWLNENSTKARISAGVMLTPNWEDSDTTANDNYKVGIDFFLKKDMKSLLMVISNRGNLRVMEFSDHLTHTQEEILDKIAGSLTLSSRQAFHTILWDSMALSEVNRKFYEGIAHLFTVLHQHLVTSGKNEEDAKLFASRLIGRLLFIWFLRKKGVLSNENHYFPHTIEDSTKYYNSVLKLLFFQTLNTPIYARENGDTVTPYLNGGLFDAHENDWAYEDVSFPTGFFSDLYDHLNKYNFTTDESSPDYEQVAIDPEMLGRVFESLLAEQTTESGEQVRKAKGAFYTPREIVSYMCKESLRQYLYTKLGDEKYHNGINKLLDSPDYEWETAHSNAKRDLWPFENMKTFIPKVIGILDSLTVLDPACGSGAFPMGMLQLLTKTYERLDSRFNPYRTKLDIIQNNIFGVDIEPMAVEISRLRAWLAIIVDDEGEIDPLPNLDFKFVCADSLIPLDENVSIWDNANLQKSLAEVREKYFRARTPESKNEWKKKYYVLTATRNMLSGKREQQLASFDPFKNQHPAKFFDPDYMFGVNEFDIVIANPPYVGEKGHKTMFDKYKDTSFGKRYYRGKMDFFYFFFHLALDVLTENGTGAFITTNYYPTADGALTLRQDLYKRSDIISLVNFNEYKIFESALGQHNLITIFKKDLTPSTSFQTNQIYVDKKGGPDGRVLKNILDKNDQEKVTYNTPTREHLYDGTNLYIRFTGTSNSDVTPILDKIASMNKQLGQYCLVNQGIITGADKFTDAHHRKYPDIIAKKGEGIFVFDKGTLSPLVNNQSIIKPWFKNSDINRYVCKTDNRFELLFSNFIASENQEPRIIEYLNRFKDILIHRSQPEHMLDWWDLHQIRTGDKHKTGEVKRIIFDYPKIVAPQRNTKNCFAYNDIPWYGSADIYYITNRDCSNKHLKSILAILNSKLIYVWLYHRGKRKGNMLELYRTPLMEIPIALPDQNTENRLEDLVNQIITQKATDEQTDTSALESQIDEIVLDLYRLTDEEKNTIRNFEP